MAITTVPILELDPENSAWSISLAREEYSDLDEESGILLRVGRTSATLTTEEARALSLALATAATENPARSKPSIEWRQGRKIRRIGKPDDVWTCLLGPELGQKTAANTAGVVYEWGPALGEFRADSWEVVE